MNFYAAAFLPQNDSIMSRINQATGTDKAKAYFEAVIYYSRNDNRQAGQLANEAYQFGRLSREPSILGYTYLTKGIYSSIAGSPDSAVYYMEKAATIARPIQDTELLLKIQSSLGKAYISVGQAENALKNLFEVLSILNDYPDSETEMKARINITWAYLELKRYEDCVSFGRSSGYHSESKNEWMIPYLYNNIAAAYGALHKVDSAKYFVEKSIPIAKANKDYHILANGYFILGNIYSNAKSYQLAIEQFEKARPYREKVGNPLFVVSDLYVLSDLYRKSGDYKNGIQVGLEALQIAEANHLQLKFEGVYQALAGNYEGLNDYKNASKYYSLLSAAKDSTYKHATAEALAELQSKYDAEKKNRQISDLSKSNQLQAATIERNYLLIIGLFLVILLLAIVFYIWRHLQKQKQLAVLQEQKMRLREAQINAVIESQEKERRRFASDLHDGMGQLIAALQLSIQSFKTQSTDLEKKHATLKLSEDLLHEVHNEIRNIAFNLMPPVLIKEGLIEATHELARKANKTTQLQVHVSAFGITNRLSEVVEVSIYRILQELLTNIMKHSNASEATIAFTADSTELIVTIEDNGDGYDLVKFKNSEGNGWRNIKSRIDLIKGELEIDTKPGRKNNTVTLTVFLNEHLEAISSLEQNTEGMV